MTSYFPQPLLDIAKFLRNHENIPLVGGTSDSRTDSGESEDPIIALINNEKSFNVKSQNIGKKDNRSWYDLLVDDQFYVDIKISNLKGNDNTSAKKAIYLALTGEDPTNISNKEAIFFSLLQANMKPNEQDFYYLIIGKKENPGSQLRAFPASLRTLNKIYSNGSNPPFQCKWKECTQPVIRSYEEAKEFLLKGWGESIKKAANKLQEGFIDNFPDYY